MRGCYTLALPLMSALRIGFSVAPGLPRRKQKIQCLRRLW